MALQVLIADDHGIVRDGINALLASEPSINVVGIAKNGREAVELVSKLKPDIVLMDVAMPDLNGIEATRQLSKDYPQLRILALSVHADPRYVRGMLCAGASGYLLKDSVFDELLFAIHAIQRGQSYLSPPIARFVLSDYRQRTIQHGQALSETSETLLTSREREILQLLAEGLTMKEVGARLCISIKTVETHRKQISDKLGIRTIAGLTKYAVREGISPIQ